jgi:hypothetical protein
MLTIATDAPEAVMTIVVGNGSDCSGAGDGVGS